jgi:hypothetical protein
MTVPVVSSQNSYDSFNANAKSWKLGCGFRRAEEFFRSPPHLEQLLGPQNLPSSGFREFFPGNKVGSPE